MSATSSQPHAVADTRERALRDLRISVTDRCNFRCRYCMPREVFGPDFAFAPRDDLLTFEEIARLVRAVVPLGVTKVRLTGGEPLLRRDLDQLVAMLADVSGIDDLALTTNGTLLRRNAAALRAAGLTRVTVSLDALDDATHRAVSDTDVPVDVVLDGVAAAAEAGFPAIKVNTVLKRGVNDDQIEPLAAWARDAGVTVRFIEYMDVGATNGWRLDEVVPSTEVIGRIGARWPLEPVPPAVAAEVADRYRYLDGGGEIGVVSSVTQPFCGSCVRARLSSTGELFTCLFATRGMDLRGPLRDGLQGAALGDLVAGRWAARHDRYSELRSDETADLPKVEMSFIGG